MQNLRQFLIKDKHIPLTPEESQRISSVLFERDPTWLLEHRNDPSTHPYFKGPFTKKNVRWYQIYCSWENWQKLKPYDLSHWDNVLNSDKYHCLSSDHIHMLTPIKQRCFDCTYNIEAEIFDDQFPYYCNKNATW